MDHREYKGRIGRLDAEANILQEIIQTCNNLSRMITDRRRSEGETPEERKRIRQQIGSAWKQEYKGMASGYVRLMEYYGQIDSWKNERKRGVENESENVPERDRLVELFRDAGKRTEELFQQSNELTSRQIIEKLDAEVDDYMELIVELKRSLELAGVDANENEVAWKTAPEIFRPSTKKSESEKSAPAEPVRSFKNFLVVDEFGRPLNDPVKKPEEEMKKNAARIVFNNGRKIIFAPPGDVQEWKAVSMNGEQYGQADGYVTEKSKLMMTAGPLLRSNAKGARRAKRKRRTIFNVRSWSEMLDTGDEAAVMDSLRREFLRQDQMEQLNWCQWLWARLLANSGGILPLERTVQEENDENSSAGSVEEQAAEEKKQTEVLMLKAAERSLLMPLLAAPTRDTIKNDDLRQQKSDAISDALLAALISGDPSTKPTPVDQAKDENDDI